MDIVETLQEIRDIANAPGFASRSGEPSEALDVIRDICDKALEGKPEPLTPEEAQRAAAACDLYADEFCNEGDDFDEGDAELLRSASRKLTGRPR